MSDRHLDLMRDRARQFPVLPDPAAYATARIWHCAYETLAPLAQFTGLTTLEIATYPDVTLEPLSRLRQLQHLSIVHLPHVTSLKPLGEMTALQTLSLSTLPSWDTAGKTTEVDSLQPLTALPQLQQLNLFGVRPPDKSAHVLVSCPALRSIRLSKFTRNEGSRVQALLDARTNADTRPETRH